MCVLIPSHFNQIQLGGWGEERNTIKNLFWKDIHRYTVWKQMSKCLLEQKHPQKSKLLSNIHAPSCELM